jgi:DnaJ domain
MTDYYEFLQISPHADTDTIHRVYRFLAARFHPDNPESGDADLFHLVRSAYDVLSDQKRRAEYDEKRKREPSDVIPLSASIDFMDDLQGELNRRLALLAVLYQRRRTKPDMPEVPLDEIETRMGFPRDYLDFTIWYLVKKGYITRADNAQFGLTAEGVDFVETKRAGLPVLNKMLTSGTRSAEEVIQALKSTPVPDAVRRSKDGAATATTSQVAPQPNVASPGSPPFIERRVNKTDRRKNSRGGRRSTD